MSTTDSKQERRQSGHDFSMPALTRHRDALVMAIIAAIIMFGCFGRTVVLGKQISKLPILAQDDFYFNNKIRYTYLRTQFDPSLYHFHIPFQLYAARELRHFRIPLWNQCFGCGFPTFAEPQYCTFSPFRGLFGAANSYLYNLGLVVKSLIAALGAFVLARLLSCSTGAAAFCAFSYGLSPFILRELELPNEMEFFPLIASIFIYCTNRDALLWRALLGLAAALFLASMHPEFFFIEMVFATALSFAVRPIIASSPRASALIPAKKCLQNIIVSGFIAVCLAAPLLLPFIELAANCESYKFYEQVIQKASIDTLLIGLTTPLYKGGSPYIGVVSLLMACFASIFGGKKCWPLISLTLILIFASSAPGILAPLAECKPFSFVPPRYLLAPLLLCLTVLAALGLDRLYLSVQEKQWRPILALAAWAALIAGIPFLFKNAVATLPGFDGTMPPAALAPAEIMSGNIALVSTFVVLAITWNLRNRSLQYATLAISLCAFNLYSLSGSTRLSLTATFPFAFTSSPAVEKIKAEDARMTATGLFCFSPNISMVYGIQDFRETGPIQPKWVNKFARTCYHKLPVHEPRRTNYYTPPLLDAASVKYILSAYPLVALQSPPLPFKPIAGLKNAPQKILDILSLEGGDYCLTRKGELFTRLKWQGLDASIQNLAMQLDIVDADGQTVRLGPRVDLSRLPKNLKGQQSISIKIPDQIEKTHGDLYLILRPVLALNEGFIPINKTDLPMRARGIELLNITQCQKDALDSLDNPLELVSEDKNQILLYKNNRALPQAYLTGSIFYAPSYDEACKRIAEPDFDPHSQTVIETDDKLAQPAAIAQWPPAKIERPDPNQVIVKVDAPVECYLVLTDTFYNGWMAFVDDRPAVIKRANVRFRAVKIPRGQHIIRFDFQPLSFICGLLIAGLCALILLIRLFYRRASARKAALPGSP